MPDILSLLTIGSGTITVGRLLHAYLKPKPPQPYEGDNLSNETEINANPFARYIIGQKVITGGTLLWVFNPTNDNGNPSDRLDLVVGISEGQLPAPSNDTDGVAFRLWINGILVHMAKDTRAAITTTFADRPDWADQLTVAEWNTLKGSIRTNAYEPTADSPLRGQLRLWWNGRADGTEGQPLQARVFQRIGSGTPSSPDDPTRATTWDATHTLKGLTWFHIALDLINKLPQNERDALDDSAEKTGITTVPRFSFEIPQGIDIAREVAGSGSWSSASQNPADVFELILKKMTRLKTDHIASLTDAKARSAAAQFRYNGIINFRQSILDLLGGPELVTNGHVAYTAGQVRFLPGQHLSRVGTLTADDILSMHQIAHDPPASRYNAVAMSLTHITQSESNTPVALPIQVNSAEKTKDDAQEIVEEVPDISFINDYRQGQQVARVRAKRHSARQRAIVRTWHTTARAGWDVGEVIGLTYPPAGLPTRKDFVIESKAIASDYQLVFTLREHLSADPFVEGADSTYPSFVEGAIPAPYYTDVVPVPTGAEATRTFGTHRSLRYQKETDLIAFFVNDPGPRFTRARLHLTPNEDATAGSSDHLLIRRTTAEGVPQAGVMREVPADHVVWTAKLALISPHNKVGAYTDGIELASASTAAATPTGLVITADSPTAAIASWDLPSVGHKRTHIDWGPGTSAPSGSQHAPATATSLTSTGYLLQMTGLTADTSYWLRMRHENLQGRVSNFASATFRTPATPTITTLAFQAGGIRGATTTQSVALPTGDDTLVLPAGTGGAGSNPTYTYTVEDKPDALDWLTINTTNRQLSGTPPTDASTGLFSFLWKVTSGDHSARLTIRVYVGSPAIEATAPPLTWATGGIRGVSAEQGIELPTDTETTDPLTLPEAEGGTGSSVSYTYSVEDKDTALSWLTIDTSTRQLSGTPTQNASTGLFTFVWKATAGTQVARLTIRVYVAPSTSDLAFTAAGIRGVSAQQGVALPSSSLTLPAAQGGGTNPTYTYAVENKDSTLSWLTINTTNRQVSGTPPANARAGLFSFTWKATAGAHSIFLTIRVYVAPGALLAFAPGGIVGVSAVQSTPLPTGTGVLTLPIGAGGAGTSPTYTYSVEDKDPALDWLTINTTNRQVSGTPPANASTGLFTFVWKVITGTQTARRTIRVYVATPAATTDAPTAPTAAQYPAILDADRTHHSVTCRWSQPTTYGLQAELEWGTLSDTEPAVFTRINIQSGLNSSPFTVENLDPDTLYAFRLRYQVQGGSLSTSYQRTARTLTAPATQATTIDITTEGNRATVDFSEYALPVGYYITVEFGTTDDQDTYTKVGSESGALYQSPHTVKDLSTAVNTAKIRIKDYIGTTQQTITKTGLSITADNTLVTSATFTAYPSFYDSTIAAQWDKPTFTGYMDTQVRWGQVNDNGTFLEEGSGLTASQVYLITGLDPNTEYTIKIKHRHQADPHLDGPELD